jgi:hypothetical protein
LRASQSKADIGHLRDIGASTWCPRDVSGECERRQLRRRR